MGSFWPRDKFWVIAVIDAVPCTQNADFVKNKTRLVLLQGNVGGAMSPGQKMKKMLQGVGFKEWDI